MAHWNYYLHDGDDSWLRDKAWPIIKSVADMFAEYVVLNETTGSYETIRLGEPDEFAYDIDNGAYTNAGIKMLLGDWAPQAAEIIAAGNRNAIAAMVSGNWSRIAADIKIPYADDEQIIVEYDGMDGTIQIKQASVTLISYPLGWRISEEQALNDMAFVGLPIRPPFPLIPISRFGRLSQHLQWLHHDLHSKFDEKRCICAMLIEGLLSTHAPQQPMGQP